MGQGYEIEGLVMAYDDIDWTETIISDADQSNVVQAIVLKSGKKAYPIKQRVNQPFSGSTSEMNAGTLRNTFTHNVSFVLLEDSPASAGFVDVLTNGKFVVILKNTQKSTANLSGNTPYHSQKYPVFGLFNGLKASAVSRDPYGDQNGGWTVTLTETDSPSAGIFLWPDGGTDAAADAAYEALKTPATSNP
jgi:hypothetical protein